MFRNAKWIEVRMEGTKDREMGEFIRICEQLVKTSGLSPRRDLDHLRRMELLDPMVDEDFETIKLRPPEPLLPKVLNWFRD